MAVDLFCSCDLDLDRMTFIYEHDQYSLPTGCAMNFLRKGFRKLSYDVHTYIHRDRRTESTEIINDATSRVVNETKACFRGLLRHQASKRVWPILQLSGPARD